MFGKTYIGFLPKHCPLPNCEEPFTKGCLEGTMEKDERRIYTYMRCKKCRVLFEITQPIAVVEEYISKLPVELEEKRDDANITHEDVRKVKDWLNEDILKTLNNQYRLDNIDS